MSSDGSTYFTGFVLDKVSGQFKMPLAPKFSAYTNFDNSIATNAWTKVSSTTPVATTRTHSTAETIASPAPFAGIYVFGFSLRFKANVTVPPR